MITDSTGMVPIQHQQHGLCGVADSRFGLPKIPKFCNKSQINMEVGGKNRYKCYCSNETKNAPLLHAIVSEAEKNVSAFYFPGHNRGRAAPPLLAGIIGKRPFSHDLPELQELDNLFSPGGVISEAQKRAAKLFGADETCFLVGGSTCGIQAAVMAACSPGDILVLPRNSHMSVFSAMVLSGTLPKYIVPDYDPVWSITHAIQSWQIKNALEELRSEGKKAAAVFITSPTYFGICSDVAEIRQVCHTYGVPLIVDEAHGGHFKFHSSFPKTALEQGADIAVQSTHKVLSSLTQSAMLHIQGKMIDRTRLNRCLQTLQSSSPSYLLLASLDACCAHVAEYANSQSTLDALFNMAIHFSSDAQLAIKEIPGIQLLDSSTCGRSIVLDPLRITVGFWELGLEGFEADDILRIEHGVVAELPSLDTLTFAVNLGTNSDDICRLVASLKHISKTCQVGNLTTRKRNSKPEKEATFSGIKPDLSPREAFFASKKRVDINDAVNLTCGELICPYPPGIPILIPGENISGKSIHYLRDVIAGGGIVTGASDPSLASILVCTE